MDTTIQKWSPVELQRFIRGLLGNDPTMVPKDTTLTDRISVDASGNLDLVNQQDGLTRLLSADGTSGFLQLGTLGNKKIVYGTVSSGFTTTGVGDIDYSFDLPGSPFKTVMDWGLLQLHPHNNWNFVLRKAGSPVAANQLGFHVWEGTGVQTYDVYYVAIGT